MENFEKESLINELILVVKEIEEVWQYHPLNSNRKDLIKVYLDLEKEKEKIENTLNSLEETTQSN